MATTTDKAWQAKTWRERLWVILPWAILVLAWFLFVIGLCVHYLDGLNADMTADLILAKRLADGHGFIVDPGWFYSSELHFLHTQWVYTPLFWLCDDWRLVRILGSAILNLLLLASFYFMLAGMKQKRLFPWLATFLLLPFGYDFSHYVNYATSYTTYLAFSFVIIGMLFYLLRAETTTKRNWLIAGGGVLSLLNAVGGFRMVVCLNLPLFLAGLIYWWLNYKTAQKAAATRCLLTTAIWFGAALAGLVINILLGLVLHFEITGYGELVWRDSPLTNLLTCLQYVIYIFGFRASGNFFSGLLSNGLALLVVLMFIVAVVDIAKHRAKYSPTTVYLMFFALIGLVCLLLVLLFFDFSNGAIVAGEFDQRYLIQSSVFILPVIVLYLLENQNVHIAWGKIKGSLKQLLALVGFAVVLVVNVYVYIYFYYFNGIAEEIWPGIDRDTLNQITQQLVADGYLQGYCTFNELIFTELSNGQIEVWNYTNVGDSDFTGRTNFDEDVRCWLQSVEHTTTHPAGKMFVLFYRQEMYYPLPRALNEKASQNVIYQDDTYVIYGFDNYEQMDAIVQNAKVGQDQGAETEKV